MVAKKMLKKAIETDNDVYKREKMYFCKIYFLRIFL